METIRSCKTEKLKQAKKQEKALKKEILKRRWLKQTKIKNI